MLVTAVAAMVIDGNDISSKAVQNALSQTGGRFRLDDLAIIHMARLQSGPHRATALSVATEARHTTTQHYTQLTSHLQASLDINGEQGLPKVNKHSTVEPVLIYTFESLRKCITARPEKNRCVNQIKSSNHPLQ